MKHMRLFPDVATRDSVLADIDYPVLHSTNGVGLGIKPGIDVPPGPDPTIPFYIENPTSSSVTTIISRFQQSGPGTPAPTLTIEKSADGTTWETVGTTSSNLSITVPANSKVYLRCDTTSWATDYNKYNNIMVGSSCNVGGNIMSLLYGSDFTGNETSFPSGSTNTFNNLFKGSGVVNAKDLLSPATTLTAGCYQSMFSGCTSLITVPELPVTVLAEHCYNQMFSGCTSLITAPELPAIALAKYCYNQMFGGCTGLTTAPELPATTLANGCYNQMFKGCTSLNDVTIYADDISASNCLNNWLSNVAATGTFHNLGSASYTSGASGIPSGWTEVHS